MSELQRIQELETQISSVAASLEKLQAVEAVRDTILRFSRGLDRMDRDLMASAFHPDAQVDYGEIFAGPAHDFVERTLLNQARQREVHHLVGNIIVQVDGDHAVAESYELARHKSPVPGLDGLVDLILAMRTLDQFERRLGVWRISHRLKVVDWARRLNGSDEVYQNSPLPKGTRDAGDPSYALFGQMRRAD